MKRTNNLYNVQVARYAWIAVEADSPKEAMEIAGNTELEGYLDDEAFEESERVLRRADIDQFGPLSKYARPYLGF